MTLSVVTVKECKENAPEKDFVRKTYRYAAFDKAVEFQGLSFELQFNKAFDVLKEEIMQDKMNNDMTKYGLIKIADVFLS